MNIGNRKSFEITRNIQFYANNVLHKDVLIVDDFKIEYNPKKITTKMPPKDLLEKLKFRLDNGYSMISEEDYYGIYCFSNVNKKVTTNYLYESIKILKEISNEGLSLFNLLNKKDVATLFQYDELVEALINSPYKYSNKKSHTKLPKIKLNNKIFEFITTWIKKYGKPPSSKVNLGIEFEMRLLALGKGHSICEFLNAGDIYTLIFKLLTIYFFNTVFENILKLTENTENYEITTKISLINEINAICPFLIENFTPLDTATLKIEDLDKVDKNLDKINNLLIDMKEILIKKISIFSTRFQISITPVTCFNEELFLPVTIYSSNDLLDLIWNSLTDIICREYTLSKTTILRNNRNFTQRKHNANKYDYSRTSSEKLSVTKRNKGERINQILNDLKLINIKEISDKSLKDSITKLIATSKTKNIYNLDESEWLIRDLKNIQKNLSSMTFNKKQ